MMMTTITTMMITIMTMFKMRITTMMMMTMTTMMLMMMRGGEEWIGTNQKNKNKNNQKRPCNPLKC